MSGECSKCGEHCLDCKCNTVMISGCPICEKCHGYSIHCKCGEHTLDCQGHKSIEQNILDMFEAASKVILESQISDPEFELCKNTIMITIEYLESKRIKGWRCRND